MGKAELLERALAQVVSMPRTAFEQSPVGMSCQAPGSVWQEGWLRQGWTQQGGTGISRRRVPGAEVKLCRTE